MAWYSFLFKPLYKSKVSAQVSEPAPAKSLFTEIRELSEQSDAFSLVHVVVREGEVSRVSEVVGSVDSVVKKIETGRGVAAFVAPGSEHNLYSSINESLSAAPGDYRIQIGHAKYRKGMTPGALVVAVQENYELKSFEAVKRAS